mgnify:CR=1 FL=1
MINCTVEYELQGNPAKGRVVGRPEPGQLDVLTGHRVFRVFVGDVVLCALDGYQILYRDYDDKAKVGRVLSHDVVTCAIMVENSLDKRHLLIDKSRVNFLLKGGQRA